MAFPPTDKEPSELFKKLMESPRPSELVDFPRYDDTGKSIARIRMQVLNYAEYDECRLRAQEWLDKKLPHKESREGQAAREVLGDRVAKEIVTRAALTEKPISGSEETPQGARYARIFRSADDVDQLTADELTCLWMAQQMVQTKYGPYEGNLESEAQITAWMKVLVEGASTLPLSQLSWHQLAELTLSLASRAYTLSAILHSQHSTLPPTLAAALENWDIGTGSFTQLPAPAADAGLSRTDLQLPDLDKSQSKPLSFTRVIPIEPVDSEMARKLSRDLTNFVKP